jgi:uncharacterized protein (DUF433 family)
MMKTSMFPSATYRVFSSKAVGALTRLTARQLQYWDETGFLKPSISARKGRGTLRLYSFQDLVALRVAAELRGTLPLQTLRRFVAYFQRLDYRLPLAEVHFWVERGRVYFREAGVTREARRPEQTVIEGTVLIREVLADLGRQIDRLDARTPGRIERRRGVMSGKPVIAGTRIPTAAIWRQVKEGLSADDVRKGYPGLTKQDIDAAVAFEDRTRASRRTA